MTGYLLVKLLQLPIPSFQNQKQLPFDSEKKDGTDGLNVGEPTIEEMYKCSYG